MIIEPVIHHHFKFSSAILNNPQRCKDITFENIPFFKLYEMQYLPQVRRVIDTLSMNAMPHKYQSTLSSIRPPKELEDCHYRVDLIPMTYCEYNKQSFFVRAYKLRCNNFFKVEVILHSQTIGKGKNYTFEKALNGANLFFKQIDSNVLECVSFEEHLPEYFLISDFRKAIRANINLLKTILDCKYSTTKVRLIEEFKSGLNNFQKNAKEISMKRLNRIKENEIQINTYSDAQALF